MAGQGSIDSFDSDRVWDQKVPYESTNIVLQDAETCTSFEIMMSDSVERFKNRPLEDLSYYSLWRIHVFAAFGAKGFDFGFEETEENYDAVDDAMASPVDNATGSESSAQSRKEMRKQESYIVISALGNQSLRFVRSAIRQTREMLKKLDLSYDSKATARKI